MNFKNMASDRKDVWQPGGSSGSNLVRQSSIYSLTFDELQNTLGGLGRDFGSMNMDEFLKSVWTAEETQVMAAAAAMSIPAEGSSAVENGMTGLHSQGSLTLPRTLSQKTVDEVWRYLFKEGGDSGQVLAGSNLHPQRREQPLGEMTLEEFLVRAGVVREDLTQSASRTSMTSPITMTNDAGNSRNSSVFYGDASTSNVNSHRGVALGLPPTAQAGGALTLNSVPNNLLVNTSGLAPPFVTPLQIGDTSQSTGQQGLVAGGGIMGIGDPSVNSGLLTGVAILGAGGMTVCTGTSEDLPSDGLGKSGEDLPPSPVAYMLNGGLRGNKSGNVVEKVVERRQRRMIKNRESAARSRARKQAYIMELEAEVAKLKEQNQELEKKQASILEMQKNQMLKMMDQQPVSKKRCLRRTQTGPCSHIQSAVEQHSSASRCDTITGAHGRPCWLVPVSSCCEQHRLAG